LGFLTEPEREFFELFCSVDGSVGVKKALRAMIRPSKNRHGDRRTGHQALEGLPGVGAATAERIIAKLRRKVPKFALIAIQ
jgi:Holliday junction DNA helicase RuvA